MTKRRNVVGTPRRSVRISDDPQPKNQTPERGPDILTIGPGLRPLRTRALGLHYEWDDDEVRLFLEALGVPVAKFKHGDYIWPLTFELAFAAAMVPNGPGLDFSKPETIRPMLARSGELSHLLNPCYTNLVLLLNFAAQYYERATLETMKMRLRRLSDALLHKWVRSRISNPLAKGPKDDKRLPTWVRVPIDVWQQIIDEKPSLASKALPGRYARRTTDKNGKRVYVESENKSQPPARSTFGVALQKEGGPDAS